MDAMDEWRMSWKFEDHLLLAGISGACLLLSASFCTWAIWHLSSAGLEVRKKLFWRQLLALSSTDLVSSLLHGYSFPVASMLSYCSYGSSDFLNRQLFWDALNVVDFTSCLLEVQIAAGFAAACSGSARFEAILQRALPLSFPAAFGLALVGRALDCEGNPFGSCSASYQWKNQTRLQLDWFWVLEPDKANILWSMVALTCCLLISIFCGYGIVKSSRVPGAIRQRGRIRGLSYATNAIITWVPIATVGTVVLDVTQKGTWFWFGSPVVLDLKTLANYLFFLNGAANVSFYVFWMWRSRQLQERFIAERRSSDAESFALDAYFDVAGVHDAETLEAMKLAAEAVAMVRLAEEELESTYRSELTVVSSTY